MANALCCLLHTNCKHSFVSHDRLHFSSEHRPTHSVRLEPLSLNTKDETETNFIFTLISFLKLPCSLERFETLYSSYSSLILEPIHHLRVKQWRKRTLKIPIMLYVSSVGLKILRPLSKIYKHHQFYSFFFIHQLH
jgi:hypothetical protein